MKAHYCRLSIILAREAHKAVIFRKGPTRWVELIVWNTDTDTFEEGQWFHGRIYDRRADLTPDGSKLIYFAADYHWRDPEDLFAWTAISKPPYLTALGLWPQGNTYGGGGYFEDDNTVCLNQAFLHEPHRNHIPPQNFNVKNVLSESYFYSEDNLSDMRLERNGWILVQEKEKTEHDIATHNYQTPGIWRKDNGEYSLIMKIVGFHRGKFGEIIEFTLQHTSTGVEITIDGATWADWDHKNRLVYVKDGCLFVGEIQDKGINSTILADFNPNKPRLIAPSEWAKQWD